MKRGFKTRREAKEWEQNFLENKAGTMEMTFAEFYDLYTEDMKPRLRMNTWMTKDYIVREKILPYFGKKRMCDIKTSDIIKWQNMLMVMKDDGDRFLYSRKYLKTIQSQFSAIMNHAVRLYNLKSNPIHAAGPIGGDDRTVEMSIWTTDEYRAFSEAISDNIESFTAFEILYWSGLRIGEVLALTPADIDFEKTT